MTMNVKRSRRVRQIAIGLGLALAVSTVGVSGSSAAKVPANTKAESRLRSSGSDHLDSIT